MPPLSQKFADKTSPDCFAEALEKLAGLRFYKHVHTEDGAMAEFFTRLDALFALWKRGGFWDYAHPWMECTLPWQSTELYLSQVLARFPPQALVGGHILLWPARGAASSAPLFMRPPGEFLMGVGILPAVAPQFLPEVLPRMSAASQAAIMMGGKRYLSGWIDFDHAAWKAHYGEKWPASSRGETQIRSARNPQPGIHQVRVMFAGARDMGFGTRGTADEGFGRNRSNSIHPANSRLMPKKIFMLSSTPADN